MKNMYNLLLDISYRKNPRGFMVGFFTGVLAGTATAIFNAINSAI